MTESATSLPVETSAGFSADLRTPDLGSFASAVIDALASHICVVDRESTITAVNRGWRNFAQANPPTFPRSGLGTNYLNICRSAVGAGSEGAGEFAVGIASVLVGRSNSFEMEYPCHSPETERWFIGRVTPLGISQGGAVISHLAITDRKRLELELLRLAETDPLTGVPNRRYFFDAANRALERVRQFGRPASLLMIDVDHFKSVNDKHGHAVGDQALRHVTQVCARILRPTDLLARLGGEEFVVLLYGEGEPQATLVAERLREELSESPLTFAETALNLTASFGVAELASDDMSVDAALSRADAALYEAKRFGRNCVMTSSRSARSPMVTAAR